ncbi:hypothetical protein THAOC_06151 [Thalassiosira oceanica]|uniref:Uncharacterized protein n=1 Tax=Thalassiosira oceanica TaxID=159749 RepID=K0T128_THAOC|nr:hypothetical protein THAOC_06151 [Thalassiosira oceanica]|eukprot:EJK72328.1 hypothetical protein THAOC_06151 [Thalassiosira oceanica]
MLPRARRRQPRRRSRQAFQDTAYASFWEGRGRGASPKDALSSNQSTSPRARRGKGRTDCGWRGTRREQRVPPINAAWAHVAAGRWSRRRQKAKDESGGEDDVPARVQRTPFPRAQRPPLERVGEGGGRTAVGAARNCGQRVQAGGDRVGLRSEIGNPQAWLSSSPNTAWRLTDWEWRLVDSSAFLIPCRSSRTSTPTLLEELERRETRRQAREPILSAPASFAGAAQVASGVASCWPHEARPRARPPCPDSIPIVAAGVPVRLPIPSSAASAVTTATGWRRNTSSYRAAAASPASPAASALPGLGLRQFLEVHRLDIRSFLARTLKLARAPGA